jgi:adenosine deaminase
VRSIEDPKLVDELARRGTVLEVCPGSNVALGLYPDRASHPLKRLIAAGVKVALGSDDPPFFHTALGQEYELAGLDEKTLLGITRTAIEASFADPATKAKLFGRIGA